MLARDTKIYKDAQLLTKKIYEVTRTFKTEYRATIARRLEEYSSQLADIIVEANFYAPNSSERAQCFGRDFIVARMNVSFLAFRLPTILNLSLFYINYVLSEINICKVFEINTLAKNNS